MAAGAAARRTSSMAEVARAAMSRRSRVRPAFAIALGSVVVGGCISIGLVAAGSPPSTPTRVSFNLVSNTIGNAALAEAQAQPTGSSLHLTPATTEPDPAPPSVANDPPIASHEVFAFAPYWALNQSTAFDVTGLSTIAYFAVGVNGDGTLAETGPGWDGYESEQLANLITRAHAAGDRVVLTVNCFSQPALNALTSNPAAPATLSSALISAVEAKNLDGVNIDFEGVGSEDQRGLTNLVSTVSSSLHAVDPNWQVTMDTYASSAGDPTSFYDIPALSPAVNAFFVMAYQLNLGALPGSGSPLTDTTFPNETTVAEYAAAVTPKKVILGLATYGYDWPTTSGALGANAVGPPSVITYGQELTSGHPMYFDVVTNTGWTSYETGGQWHQAFFEDPQSLYMAAQLAQSAGLAGVGEWALGFDGNSPTIIDALGGMAPPEKNLATGPVATSPLTSTTTTVTTHHTFSGMFDDHAVELQPVKLSGPGAGSVIVGSLTTFTTNDPALSCLGTGAPLTVWKKDARSKRYFVTPETPDSCVGQSFIVASSIDPSSTTTSTSTASSSAPGSTVSKTSLVLTTSGTVTSIPGKPLPSTSPTFTVGSGTTVTSIPGRPLPSTSPTFTVGSGTTVPSIPAD